MYHRRNCASSWLPTKNDKYCRNISADFEVTVPPLDMQFEHVYVPHVQRTDTQDQSLCCNYMASAEAE